jgi:acyl carrier protein
VSVPLAQVAALVALRLGRVEVAADDRLFEDLAAESGDLVVLLADLEERHGVIFAEAEIAEVRTVGDLHRLLVRGLERRGGA